MKLLLAILLTLPLSALAQFGAGVAAGGWEPLNIVTKAGIVACYDAGNASTITLNGTGVQQLRSRVVGVTNHLNQATAGNQPLISRSDNKGNCLVQSETFQTTWARSALNAFGVDDSGATNAGSFANTSRTSDPFGGNASDFIQEDNTTTVHYIQQSTLLHAGPLTLSCWIKSTNRWTLIDIFVGSEDLRQSYDITTGNLGTHGTGGSTTFTSATITENPVSSGWYLCTLSGNLGASGLVFFVIRSGIANGCGSYTGDSTSGLFVCGAQIRYNDWGANYISTTTSRAIPALNNRTTLYCDGAAHYLKAAAFTLNQPTESYRLCMPWTWTLNDAAFDGNSSGSGKLYQSATTPNIRMNAGTDATEFVPPAAGTWRVTSTVFDGANSRMSTNNGAWVTSDAGTNNMGGFTLSANGANTEFWNGQVAYQILCSKTNGTPEANFLRTCLMRRAGL